VAQRLGMPDGRAVADAFRRGEEPAVQAVRASARILGRTVLKTIQEDVAGRVDLSTLEQTEIPAIFGGGFAVGLGQQYVDMIQDAVNAEGGKTRFPKPVRVILSPMDESQRGLVGAAARVPEAAAGLEGAPTVTYNPAPVTRTGAGTPIATISRLQAELTTRVTGYTPGKQTAKLAFVVDPDGVAKFAVAGVVFGATNIAADVVARDEEQQRLIEQHLAALGFDMTKIIVYSAAGEPWNGDITRAMNGLARSRRDDGYTVQPVTRDTGLNDIGRFLGIAAAESDLEAMELIAADSNDTWL